MNTKETFDLIMSGKMAPEEIKAVLTAFHEKGITPDDLMAAASAMREAGIHVACPHEDAIDIVGTGGDLAGTFNVSTTAAFIAAGAGVTIAKHGNRAATSKCGTADVLEALGYDLEMSAEDISKGIDKNGIGFLFAKNLHPAMRFAAPVRRELKFKTIFNYLGPLTNPAQVKQHVIGVADASMLKTFAITLKKLGSRGALIVCGNNGLDEISTDGLTRFAMLRNGVVSEGEIDIGEIYGETYPVDAIAGGEPNENAMILKGVLMGTLKGAYRMAAVINAAAAIWVADIAHSLQEGIALAQKSIDSGAAYAKLEAFLASSKGEEAAKPNILKELTEARAKDVEHAASVRDFAASFKGEGIHIISELKKASPSKGLIRPYFNPAALAKELTEAGAAALSVLAEPHKFLGSEENVRIARANSTLPILFKDFVSSEYQILRARACGADAILLIAAVLDDEKLAKLLSYARSLGMEALVETHTSEEIARAVKVGAKVIGVNCRDLKTFKTDPSITAALIKEIPEGIVKIAESGIRGKADILALREAGADGFLIGETLMKEPSPGAKLKELI